MKQRTLGTGLTLSEIGFGCMSLATPTLETRFLGDLHQTYGDDVFSSCTSSTGSRDDDHSD